MGRVINLDAWRQAREGHPAGRSRGPAAAVAATGAPVELARAEAGIRSAVATPEDRPSLERDLDRLERAVQRLHPLVSQALERGRRLEGKVETELLAIMGELTVGLVREATRRAQRLADRLAVVEGNSKS